MKAHFPVTPADAAALLGRGGAVRAGGTDLQERLDLGGAPVALIDLRDVAGIDAVAWRGHTLEIGARVRVADIAAHPDVAKHYPGLAAAAGGLATPQIRRVGTLGGNLLQRVRCWYFRNPDVQCMKKGGDACWAREGDHLYHSCFDLGPCIAPHPSTLGMALLAHDATATLASGRSLSMAELFGNGDDPTRENTLAADELLTHVTLPAPVAGELAAYLRTIARARAEWPLVEAIARLAVDGDGRVRMAAVVIGGVAVVPLRLPKVEQALMGESAGEAAFARAAALATDGAAPLPMTRYKIELLAPTVEDALARALASGEVA